MKVRRSGLWAPVECHSSASKSPWHDYVIHELKMAGVKKKHTIWALLISLLALITNFQQNYHNNQLVVTPNEMVGLYCRDR